MCWIPIKHRASPETSIHSSNKKNLSAAFSSVGNPNALTKKTPNSLTGSYKKP